MPELAEVEYFRKRWDRAVGRAVAAVEIHPRARCCAGLSPAALRRALVGARLLRSLAAAKQMAFVFSGGAWLGVHLGMTGSLAELRPDEAPGRHDHLVLRFRGGPVVAFRDPRMFGRLRLHAGPGEPAWWTDLAPAILSPAFRAEDAAAFLRRRARSPIKAVLLMQERFPGIGNWMADEVLWRAGFHPKAKAGAFGPRAVRRLHATLREVCRDALRVIGKDWSDPPDSWLFNHRWEKGGRCPRTRGPLSHATVGGRTTCWSPRRQALGAERR
jgi:formamidopyrimidine-DNA glycosylase